MSVAAPMVPVRYRVAAVHRETADTSTLTLDPVDEAIAAPGPGQFTMLYRYGTGEIPVSVSGAPAAGANLRHTIRGVGAVSQALIDLPVGSMLGVRGPFGAGWALEEARGGDVVVVAGGIGLAPLRPVVHEILEHRSDFGAAAVLVGARRPEDLLFRDELAAWAERPDLHTAVTVDVADRTWRGEVGVVTQLLAGSHIEAVSATALVCGPEVMIRAVAGELVPLGVDPERILVSLERNMHCAVGHCGRCQLGPVFVCADGPVLSWAEAQPLLAVRRW